MELQIKKNQVQDYIREEIRYQLTTILTNNISESLKILNFQDHPQPRKEFLQILSDNKYPYYFYKGKDSRIIKILMALSRTFIYMMDADDSLLELIQRSYWQIKEIQYKFRRGQKLQVIVLDKSKKHKDSDQIKYVHMGSKIHINFEYMKEYNLEMIFQLFEKLKKSQQQQSADEFYLDRIKYIDILKLRLQNKKFTDAKNLLISNKKCSQKFEKQIYNSKYKRIQKQIQQFNNLIKVENQKQSQQKRFQNINSIVIENIEPQELRLANSSTINIWINIICNRLKNCYSQIDSNDQKGKKKFRSLYQNILKRFRTLQDSFQNDHHNLDKIKLIINQIKHYYDYHQEGLNLTTLSKLKYFSGQLKYNLSQKKFYLEKLLVIVMFLLVIQILFGNNLTALASVIVGGIFYLKYNK